MRKFIALLCFLPFLVGPAFSADVLVKTTKTVAKVPTCTVFSCLNKFYVGAGMAGNGTNADIIGNGLSGSVFAGGGIPFVDAGYMTWNGSFLFGAEVGAGYQFNVGASTNNQNTNIHGYMAYQEMIAGGALGQLFGGGPTPNPPTGLTADVMAPYLSFGAEERPFGTGWRTGAGIKFVLPNSNLILDLGYRYTNFGSQTVGAINVQAINLVYAKVDVPLN